MLGSFWFEAQILMRNLSLHPLTAKQHSLRLSKRPNHHFDGVAYHNFYYHWNMPSHDRYAVDLLAEQWCVGIYQTGTVQI